MDLKLRNTWSQVLDLDDSDLGEDTNFFEAGGDSVAALRLVSATEAIGLSVHIEDVFNCPTLGELAKKCQEANHVSKPKDPESQVSVLDQGTVEECASACQVERDTIEDIFPASHFQKLVFESGKAYGTYMLQWVFQIRGQVDRNIMAEAWDRLQQKHQILRTRLVKIGSDYFQVILQSDMEWQEGKDLSKYKRKILSETIDSGRPLFHYAWITEEDDHYFVWTAHHAGFDGTTRRMIFEELQESLSKPLEYAQKPNGISYKRLISWSQHQQESVSSAYWESVLKGFNGSQSVFPLSLQSDPVTNSTLSRSWSWASVKKSKFTMATIAHSAWAISLGNVSDLTDIFFCTARSGRYAPIPGIDSIFGPMVVINPVRIILDKEKSLEDYMQSIQTQLASMTQHERDGYRIAPKIVGRPQFRQSYFSWHPRGDDVLSKDISYESQEGLTVKLEPRRDLSTPFAANFGLALDVHEQESSVAMHANWDDRLRSQSDIEQLMTKFVHNLDQLARGGVQTVGDLWPGRGSKWVYSEPDGL